MIIFRSRKNSQKQNRQMQIQECIANLLYLHNSVSLPGFGTIVAQYHAAVIDHVQGKLTPPSKNLSFDTSIDSDDGLLTEEVAKVFRVSHSEASEKVAAFIQTLSLSIANGELVGISGVGRLFRDVEGRIQFLPEEQNFNPESFGLPELQYHPVIRRPATASGEPKAPPALPVKPLKTSWWQRNVLWLALIAIILLSVSIVWIQFSNTGSTSETAELPQEFLNVAPGETKDAKAAPLEEEALAEEQDSDAPTMPPNQKICTIRIGKFGNADNVRRLVRKAQELGMNPYTRKDGGLTEVGVTFPYSEEKEIQQMLADARKYLSPDAVIEKK
jgi:cell division septation protein DedD/nucleoid DNA-binding protein